jgi:AbrB family looped-hinge helix DNA binding protein
MPSVVTVKTILSTKGQMVLPKAVRDRKQWKAGTRLVIEDRPEGLLIRQEPPKASYSIDDLVGILKYDGPPISIEEMNEAVLETAAERYARTLPGK